MSAAPQPARGPGEFAHTIRPAHVPATHTRQRYFGESEQLGVLGLRSISGARAASVMRYCGDAYAQVQVDIYAPDDGGVRLRVNLAPDALRELARCLLDAAADIEAGVEKPAAQGAA